jgi:uncharacterized protein
MKRVLILLIVVALFCSCRSLFAEPIMPRVCFKDACFKVELAATEETRRQGLMDREQLASDQGMLFIFDVSGEYGFWMKNTLIALDMIWLDENKKVVHIEANVPPCVSDPCPIYSPVKPAVYVLELSAGVAAQEGIGLGDVLQMDTAR